MSSVLQFICGLTAGMSNGIAAAKGYYPMYPPYMGYGCRPYMPFIPFGRGYNQPYMMFNGAAGSMLGGMGTCYWGGGAGTAQRIDTQAIDAQVGARVQRDLMQITFTNISSDYSKITSMLKSINKALEDTNSRLTDEMKTELEGLKIDLEAQKEALQPYIDKAKEGDIGDTKLEDAKSSHETANTLITKAESTMSKIQKKLAEIAAQEEESESRSSSESETAAEPEAES